jgi:hypothetical protein
MEIKEIESEEARLSNSKVEHFEVDAGDVNVEEFRPTYLGITIVKCGGALAYVRSCIKKANAVSVQLYNISTVKQTASVV